MYDGKSVEMFFCAWFLINAWTHVVAEKAEKELKLFFNNAEDFTTVKKVLLPLSDRFTTIIHSTDVSENTVCTEFLFDIASESGQTALMVLPSVVEDPPSCFSHKYEGNVVYAFVRPNDVEYGNLKKESDPYVGDIEDLVEYLDGITTEQDLVHEVSDTYTGVKEYVSLLHPIYVPLWLVILIAILLILSIFITLIIQCREPTAKDSQRVNAVKKTDSISESPGRCSTISEPQSMSASHKYATSSEKKRRLKRSLPAVDPESKGKEDEFPAKQRDVNELIKEPVTSTEFELYLNRLARFVIQYYDKPTMYDVTPDVKRGFLYNKLPKNCPQNPDAFKAIFDDFKNQVVPGLTHWQHPFFFAYYPIGRCYPDVLADFITSAISAIGFSWDSCPALTEVEHAIVNWVGRAFGIPESFLFQDCPESSQGGGTLTESGSDAIFCALLAARQWKINQVAEQQQRTGVEKYGTIHDIAKRLVVYCSKDAHFFTEKGCRLAMLRCRAIQPLEENQWGLTGEQIQMEIEKDIEKGLIPCFISCTLGTTTTASSDKLTSIVPVAKKYDTWLHVDADYAGSAFIVQKNREVAEGIENAHTINVNLSKFLLHSATLSMIWTRDQKVYKDAFAVTPIYLKPSHDLTDLRDWGLHLSRRFKGLRVWFIMRLCGTEGLRRHVNKICDMASYFETLVDQHPNLQIFTSRKFGVFTFHYTEPHLTKEEKNKHTIRFLHFLNESHKIFLTHSQVADTSVIRVSVSYERTTKKIIDQAYALMKFLVEEYKRRKDDPSLLKTQLVIPSIKTQDSTDDNDGELELATTPAVLIAKNTDDPKKGTPTEDQSRRPAAEVSSVSTSGHGNPAGIGKVSASGPSSADTVTPSPLPLPMTTSQTPFKE